MQVIHTPAALALTTLRRILDVLPARKPIRSMAQAGA
jgi:hypothetical protein